MAQDRRGDGTRATCLRSRGLSRSESAAEELSTAGRDHSHRVRGHTQLRKQFFVCSRQCAGEYPASMHARNAESQAQQLGRSVGPAGLALRSVETKAGASKDAVTAGGSAAESAAISASGTAPHPTQLSSTKIVMCNVLIDCSSLFVKRPIVARSPRWTAGQGQRRRHRHRLQTQRQGRPLAAWQPSSRWARQCRGDCAGLKGSAARPRTQLPGHSQERAHGRPWGPAV
jgi:hypothetical protein